MVNGEQKEKKGSQEKVKVRYGKGLLRLFHEDQIRWA